MNETRTAVVAGGTGSIGEGIVKALLDAGFVVYVPFRQHDRTERLKEYTGSPPELRLVLADLCDDPAVVAMKDTVVAETGRIDAVVVSVGADYFGYRLHRMPRSDWDLSIRDNLATHFNMQRIFVEELRRADSGVYITLVGPEAENVLPDSGMKSVMAVAQKMMTRVLAAESTDSAVRIHALTAHTTINTRNRGGNNNPHWIDAREIGDYIVGLIGKSIPGHAETLHELYDLAQVRKLLGRS